MVTSPHPTSDSPVALSEVRTPEPLLSIAAVEQETGLGKDTLRAWERRYGFPRPLRDAAGDRCYPRSLVDRLVLVRRALLAGLRPGRLLALPEPELDALLAQLAAPPPAPARTRGVFEVAGGVAALRSGGAEALRHWLTLGLARTGLATFVVDGVAPLTEAVGEAWLAGSIAVYEEHLYSEAVQSVLRSALVPFQTGLEARAPRLLLTTVPGEAHGLGLLMAEAMLTLQACRWLPLGTQTPLADIVAAAAAHRIDVVALSFSQSLPDAQSLAALAELRARLPASVTLWAGGGSPALRGLRIAGVRVLTGLVEVGAAVTEWRKDAGEPAN
ncbi:MAG: cobalamin B12-binding domain-containing protein [Caulobacter sp.]|nr:cobalamin B12-binding domain-containing protein [Vitreoscilla sp.]